MKRELMNDLRDDDHMETFRAGAIGCSCGKYELPIEDITAFHINNTHPYFMTGFTAGRLYEQHIEDDRRAGRDRPRDRD